MAVYLDDMAVLDSDATARIKTIRAFFERQRKHNPQLPPSKARLGATDADFLGHPSSSTGVCPNTEKESALMKMLMPRNLKQVRALTGGVGYYRQCLLDL